MSPTVAFAVPVDAAVLINWSYKNDIFLFFLF